jgi:hypothetical protein
MKEGKPFTLFSLKKITLFSCVQNIRLFSFVCNETAIRGEKGATHREWAVIKTLNSNENRWVLKLYAL